MLHFSTEDGGLQHAVHRLLILQRQLAAGSTALVNGNAHA